MMEQWTFLKKVKSVSGLFPTNFVIFSYHKEEKDCPSNPHYFTIGADGHVAFVINEVGRFGARGLSLHIGWNGIGIEARGKNIVWIQIGKKIWPPFPRFAIRRYEPGCRNFTNKQ